MRSFHSFEDVGTRHWVQTHDRQVVPLYQIDDGKIERVGTTQAENGEMNAADSAHFSSKGTEICPAG
jgi:hypothetical protein